MGLWIRPWLAMGSCGGYGYGGYGYGGGPLSATTTIRKYTRGTLVIDVWDARTKQLVWRGTASDYGERRPGEERQKGAEGAGEAVQELSAGKEGLIVESASRLLLIADNDQQQVSGLHRVEGTRNVSRGLERSGQVNFAVCVQTPMRVVPCARRKSTSSVHRNVWHPDCR